MLIVPAILENDFAEFQRKLDLVSEFSPKVQIDIADGIFVPNLTVAVAQAAKVAQAAQVELEWHLMVLDVLNSLDSLKSRKSQTVIFHDEATEKPKQIIEAAKSKNLQVGVAINPSTPSEAIDQYADKIDLVTVMTVEPGFQGAPFISKALEKVSEIKSRFSKLKVEVDGGVNETNLEGAAATGVDQIVVGSGIWRSGDPVGRYRELTDRLKEVS